MQRDERLCAARDFAAVRAQGRAVHCTTLTLSWLPTNQSANRFGFVVSKRVGKAVTRNLVKRRLRAIMQARVAVLRAGHDIVLTARPSAVQRPFHDLARDVDDLVRRARLAQPPARPPSPTLPVSDPEGGSV